MRACVRPPCLSSSPPPLTRNLHSSLPTSPSSSSSSSSLFLYTFRPFLVGRRFHLLRPCSSLKESKQRGRTLQKSASPPSLRRRLLNSNQKGDPEEIADNGGDAAVKGSLLAGLLLVGFVGGFGAVGYVYKDQINAFLTQFSGFIEAKELENFLWDMEQCFRATCVPDTGRATTTSMYQASDAKLWWQTRMADDGSVSCQDMESFDGAVFQGDKLFNFMSGLQPCAQGELHREGVSDLPTAIAVAEGYGPAGYAIFVAVYAGLEVLAIPAIPLTMSAGLLFGSLTGTILVSISGTVAASVAFLIARYFARERILKLVEGNKKFLAIDKAIGENGFRVVTLLRLSPLLPFSLGNYLYGLTSVKFVPYVLGSWLGMLPGTWAYVSAGAFGRAIISNYDQVDLKKEVEAMKSRKVGDGSDLETILSGLGGTVEKSSQKLRFNPLTIAHSKEKVFSRSKEHRRENKRGIKAFEPNIRNFDNDSAIRIANRDWSDNFKMLCVLGFLKQEESEVGLPGGNGQLLTLGVGLLATALAAAYVTQLAKDAVKDIE
ncbi:hypothetical protein RJ640_020451 [Escallonia rubra]|uniref:VTT domain-containing protein n=1 Tax=Escallonia rubra TaxID=112253 RepID=A0AA88REI6_9ASTE|nr:hypothetical protein RJ640_020451 [Escallonia rubra]